MKHPAWSPAYVQLYMKRKYYERDLAYLTMIDSFTQDAPQLLLQSFILLSNHYSELQHWETSVTQLASVILSLLSLSLSLVSYSQAHSPPLQVCRRHLSYLMP